MFVKSEMRAAGWVHAGRYSKRDPWAWDFAKQLNRDGIATSADVRPSESRIWLGVSQKSSPLEDAAGHVVAEGEVDIQSRFMEVRIDALKDNLTLVNSLVELARRGGTPHPLKFDKVIRCLGWRHELTQYTDETRPSMQYNGKYPMMTAEYESNNVTGMYFAGQLGHGKDHLKSAGGFIHGFRYTSRALFRILEAKYHPVPGQLWPAQTTFSEVQDWSGKGLGLGPNGCNAGDWTHEQPCTEPVVPKSPFEAFLNRFFSRMNTASGPYQMVSLLADGIVLRCSADRSSATAEYLEEVPIEYFNQRFSDQPRLLWQFGYEKQRQSLHESRRRGTLFQIHLWYYPGSENADCAASLDGPATVIKNTKSVRTKEVFRIGEELHTSWDAWEMRARTGEWLHSKIMGVLERPVPSSEDEQQAALDAAQTIRDQIQQCAGELDNVRDLSNAACADPAAAECKPAQQALSDLMTRCKTLIEKSKATKVTLDTTINTTVDNLVGSFGEIQWEVPQKELKRCLDEVKADYGDLPALRAKRQAKDNSACAVRYGKEWPGGLVYLNIHNHCDMPLNVWKGSMLLFKTPQVDRIHDILRPGTGVRFTGHEREVWGVTDGKGKNLLEWAVDVSNGVVQDFVVRNCSGDLVGADRRLMQ